MLDNTEYVRTNRAVAVTLSRERISVQFITNSDVLECSQLINQSQLHAVAMWQQLKSVANLIRQITKSFEIIANP